MSDLDESPLAYYSSLQRKQNHRRDCWPQPHLKLKIGQIYWRIQIPDTMVNGILLFTLDYIHILEVVMKRDPN